MFDDKVILVTGGTGSFGREFLKRTLRKYNPTKIIIYSRDEMKQWELAKQYDSDHRVRFFVGDVRDRDRLHLACKGVDYIVHAAALKIIPTAEYNPFECIKTNVLGAMNVVHCALENQVKRVIALSTDKACNPINLYGATKLCSDKIFVAGGSYVGKQDTRFAVVRYGNVMGSRGSVIPLFRSLRCTGVLPVTDERMTRFMLSLDRAVDLVWLAFEKCAGGEIFVPKIPSMKVIDIARAVAPEAKLRIIGIRPGEKLHEQMISCEDARQTYDCGGYFKIMPRIQYGDTKLTTEHLGKLCPEGFEYSSCSNTDWMSVQQLRDWLQAEYGEEYEDAGRGAETAIMQTPGELPGQKRAGEILRRLLDSMKSAVPEQTMLLSEAVSREDTDSQLLYLTKAVAEIRLGFLDEAHRSLSNLLGENPDHREGRMLFDELQRVLEIEAQRQFC
jgi:UDP-N-acetylglucosamine 4,6-dehydratase/5-epimerase